MASFKSVLSAIGHFMAKAFSPKAIQIEASIADLALRGFAPLINLTAGAIINAENAAIAAGVQSGTGEQKAAIVVSAVSSAYQAFAQQNGIPVIPANVNNFVAAIVAALNSFPAPNVPAA